MVLYSRTFKAKTQKKETNMKSTTTHHQYISSPLLNFAKRYKHQKTQSTKKVEKYGELY